MAREHLFISYAWEDGQLAEWLALKLTALGYKVWCDRFEILGGSRWPDDIDKAIKNDTFRMIHLLSPKSIDKENPKKERQLALAISKERKEDFLIPLNLGGVPSTALPWQLSDVQYIPFEDWAAGLKLLLRTLEKIGTPKMEVVEGRAAAITAALPPASILPEREDLTLNLFRVRQVPAVIKRFKFSRSLTEQDLSDLSACWAFYKIDQTSVVSFTEPPRHLFVGKLASAAGGSVWAQATDIDGIKPHNLVSSLLRQSFTVYARSKGLRFDVEDGTHYFLPGTLIKDRISFVSYTGRRTWVSVLGQRRISKGKFRFALGFQHWVLKLGDEWFIQIRITPKIFDDPHETLRATRILQRRKKVTRGWWNHQWLLRHLAVSSYLFAGSETGAVGTVEGDSVIFEGSLVTASSDSKVDEPALEELRSKIDRAEPEDVEVEDVEFEEGES